MWSLGFVNARLDLGHWFWREVSLCGYKTKPRVVCKTSWGRRGEIQEKFLWAQGREISVWHCYWLSEGTFPKRICCGKFCLLAGPYSWEEPYCTAAVQAVRPLESTHLMQQAGHWVEELSAGFWPSFLTVQLLGCTHFEVQHFSLTILLFGTFSNTVMFRFWDSQCAGAASDLFTCVFDAKLSFCCKHVISLWARINFSWWVSPNWGFSRLDSQILSVHMCHFTVHCFISAA